MANEKMNAEAALLEFTSFTEKDEAIAEKLAALRTEQSELNKARETVAGRLTESGYKALANVLLQNAPKPPGRPKQKKAEEDDDTDAEVEGVTSVTGVSV